MTIKSIETVAELKLLLSSWFDWEVGDFVAIEDRQIIGTVDRKLKDVYSGISHKTDAKDWDFLEGGNYFYKNELMNFSLYLRSARTASLVIASINDKHAAHMAKHMADFTQASD